MNPAMWPAILTLVGTVVGLILGFGLNEVSSIIRSRREDQRTISKTLAELLEVRHVLRTLPATVQALKKVLPTGIAPHDELMLRNVVWMFVPVTEGMQKRYEDAVSDVAAFLPLLAFDLRSKDVVGPTLGRLRSTLPIEPAAAPLWLKMEDEIVKFSLPKLEELIQELAELHGIETADKVRALLRKPIDMPPEFEQFLTQSIGAMVASAQAAQAGVKTQPSVQSGALPNA